MSEFDPRYHRSPKVSPGIEVEDFQPETFARLEKAEPIPDPEENFDKDAPPKPPAPDPFAEFEVDRRPVSSLMDDLPSLDGLFKPFNLESESPAPEEGFEEIFSPGPPQEYLFEDLDTRDPNIINTLSKAEAKRDEIIRAAEEEAARLRQSAETERRGQSAELEAQRQAFLEEARREAEELSVTIRQAAAEDREAAENERREMESQRAAAEESRKAAEAQLASAAERIAGLDGEREKMEAEMAARKSQMEADHSALMAELEGTRASLFQEAESSGHEQGYSQGLDEGRKAGYAEASQAFQEKVEGLLTILDKMESIYDDLWRANEPMMIELAIEGAERILNRELDDRRDLAARAFEATIDYLSQAHEVKLMVNPREVAALEEVRAEQRHRLGALVNVRIQPDESLGPGDLIVESDVGRLDATVKHRAAQVLDVLREAFAGNYSQRPEKFRAEVLSHQAQAQEESPPPEEPVLEGEFVENGSLETEAAPPENAAGVSPEPGQAEVVNTADPDLEPTGPEGPEAVEAAASEEAQGGPVD